MCHTEHTQSEQEATRTIELSQRLRSKRTTGPNYMSRRCSMECNLVLPEVPNKDPPFYKHIMRDRSGNMCRLYRVPRLVAPPGVNCFLARS